MSSSELGARPLRVLLVEDNPDDAFLLERHLQRNGFAPEIERVETASEMIAALEQPVPPQIVLADYNLPSFSGPEALQLVRSSGHDIPFIMMSGAISEEMAVASMRAGAQDYIAKQNLARLVPALERELKEVAARRTKVAAEQALRLSETRFHHLVEAMPLGLIISDATGCVSYANEAAARLLGYTRDTLVAGDVRLSTICPRASDFAEIVSSPEPFEVACTTAKGDKIDTLLGIAVLNPGESETALQYAAFIADLSLQKKSEEVLRRTEKLSIAGRFAASIAHEINNPLEAITNCLFLLQHTELSPDGRGYLELAQKELDRVAQITMQTLRFYRRSTRAADTDVHDLIATVLALFESRLRRISIELIPRLRPIPLVFAHDGEIRQVLANLIGNAIDALPRGGKILLRTGTACCTRTNRPGISITVADTGVGMDGQTLSRIFEPFFSTKGITGTGLGLWISHEIVERHQGYLHVRSRQSLPGSPGGTVFRLFLPLQASIAETVVSDVQAAIAEVL